MTICLTTTTSCSYSCRVMTHIWGPRSLRDPTMSYRGTSSCQCGSREQSASSFLKRSDCIWRLTWWNELWKTPMITASRRPSVPSMIGPTTMSTRATWSASYDLWATCPRNRSWLPFLGGSIWMVTQKSTCKSSLLVWNRPSHYSQRKGVNSDRNPLLELASLRNL